MTAAPDVASVFLLAENRLLREALTKIFERKSDLRVVGACAFSPAAVEQIALATPNVLVLDSFAEGLHLDFLREAHRRFKNLKVVLIGMEANEVAFLRAVREGALGYVLKDASALQAVATVRAVASGEAVCPPQLSAALFRCVARQQHHVPSFHVKLTLGLTNREQQLVVLIGKGLTNEGDRLPIATCRANGAQPRPPYAAQSWRQQPAGGRGVVPHAGFAGLRAQLFHVRSSSQPQVAFAESIFSTQIDGGG